MHRDVYKVIHNVDKSVDNSSVLRFMQVFVILCKRLLWFVCIEGIWLSTSPQIVHIFIHRFFWVVHRFANALNPLYEKACSDLNLKLSTNPQPLLLLLLY